MRQLFLLSSPESLRVYEGHSGWRLMTLCTLRRFSLVELTSLTLGQELVKEKGQLLLQAVGCRALLLAIRFNQ